MPPIIPPARQVILAAHLVLHGYGHWLPNDLRGSGSHEFRKDELKQLGEIHFGRKIVQPPREELRRFYREADELLDHKPLWYRTRELRETIGNAIGRAAEKHGYTIWACAVCSNHAHVVVRTHRDRAEVIWMNLALESRDAVRATGIVGPDHPVWSDRPYKVFLHTPVEVNGRIDYVEVNPEKEKLPRQVWGFVKAYPARK